MAHKADKSIKNKQREFDIEIEFQDTSRPNAKKSEPARTTSTSSNRDVKKGGTTKDKKM